jgi:spore coat protein U-like protein
VSARGLLAALGGALLTMLPTDLTAQVLTCSISTTGVSFGTYDVFATAPLDSTGSVTYNCLKILNASITITLDKGGASTFNPRRMLKGGEALDYNLYRDAARTTIWGDGTGGSQVYTDPSPPNNQNVTVTIYARIFAQQDVSAGAYTNTITATINF